MASPQVAGAAALILSTGYLSATALKARILNNVDPSPLFRRCPDRRPARHLQGAAGLHAAGGAGEFGVAGCVGDGAAGAGVVGVDGDVDE